MSYEKHLSVVEELLPPGSEWRPVASAWAVVRVLEGTGQIVQRTEARTVGADQLVDYEMRNPRPLADIAAGVRDAKTREEMYAMAFAVVRADENVTGAERIYLAQLAHALGLDPATAARIEGVAAAGIDAAGKDAQ